MRVVLVLVLVLATTVRRTVTINTTTMAVAVVTNVVPKARVAVERTVVVMGARARTMVRYRSSSRVRPGVRGVERRVTVAQTQPEPEPEPKALVFEPANVRPVRAVDARAAFGGVVPTILVRRCGPRLLCDVVLRHGGDERALDLKRKDPFLDLPVAKQSTQWPQPFESVLVRNGHIGASAKSIASSATAPATVAPAAATTAAAAVAATTSSTITTTTRRRRLLQRIYPAPHHQLAVVVFAPDPRSLARPSTLAEPPVPPVQRAAAPSP